MKQPREFVDRLLALKRQGEESTIVERAAWFETYLSATMADVASQIPKNLKKVPDDGFNHCRSNYSCGYIHY